MSCPLSRDIQKAYEQLMKTADSVPASKRRDKIIEGTGGRVSVSDVIAYQIGWGKCLIRWYEAGAKGDFPEMPGHGFLKWDYIAIAEHFCKQYLYDASTQQMAVFEKVVFQILEITQKEQQTGNLDQEGIWPWCTLSSGKNGL